MHVLRCILHAVVENMQWAWNHDRVAENETGRSVRAPMGLLSNTILVCVSTLTKHGWIYTHTAICLKDRWTLMQHYISELCLNSELNLGARGFDPNLCSNSDLKNKPFDWTQSELRGSTITTII